jgi:hypothetical protein
VSIEFSFSKTGSLSGLVIGGIIFMFLVVIGLYIATMLHARKVIDMFKLCKKAPPTAQELSRMKYDEMMRSIASDPQPTANFDELKNCQE